MEKLNFIAERPHIFDSELVLPSPHQNIFTQMARDQLADNTEMIDETEWYFKNRVEGYKSEYFRMRYRGEKWPWNSFHPNEELSQDGDTQIDQLLSHGYWAPAVDTALEMYEQTEEAKYKTTAVFALGLHLYDFINHSWPFLDQALADESGVREKHFLGPSYRILDVSKLPLGLTELSYFTEIKKQFHMTMVELTAQSAVHSCSLLAMSDTAISKTGEYHGFAKARSSLLDLTYLSIVEKYKVIERYKQGALMSLNDEYSSPYFQMCLLHLTGLTTMSAFYSDDEKNEPKWWLLSPAEIMAGDISRAESNKPEEFEQNALF